MENQPLNQTQMEQMPNDMNGVPGKQPPTQSHTGRSIFVAILIIIIFAFFGYWYFTAPNKVPTVEEVPQQQAVTTEDNDAMANVLEAEADLGELYFESVSDGI